VSVKRLTAYGEPVEGTPFGRYRLIELLGRGGMGEVWRAHDTATNNRTVAIKLLPPQLAADRTFVARFRREADAAAGLNNPHIIPIHTYGEIDGRLYVDMRLVEGRDLEQVVAGGPLEPGRAVRIVEQVAKALHAAHKIGLVHRDVKPSNILLDEDDFAYLIDFGIARGADETGLTGSGSIIGSWHYMSPERLQAGEVDARSDVYALACVLYECLTGNTPYPGNNTEQQVTAHLMVPPPRPSSTDPHVPATFDAVIATGMAKDPGLRYATTVELARAAREAITTPLAPPAEHAALDDAPRSPPAVWQQRDGRAFAATRQRLPGRSSVPQSRHADRRSFEPVPTTPQRRWLRRRPALIAATVVIVVLVGAVIIAPQLLQPNPPTSQTPTAQPAPPSGQAAPPAELTAQPAPPSSGVPSSASTPNADVPGLAPFVGVWQDHTGRVVIDSTGTGRMNIRAPSGERIIDFALTSVSHGFASGNVTAGAGRVGAPVTATLAAVLPGQLLQMTVDGLMQQPFCNSVAEVANQCGA
jgi:serine/threonine-protein kinase